MKSVALYSGGLDSSLAVELANEWGAQVFPLHISHGFLSIKNLPEITNLKTIDASEELIDVVRSPQHGYGKNLNPCIDCHILMLKSAKAYMNELNADFIVTGDVLDQRPMSQHLDTLMLIDKAADLEGMVVRPLSAGLLPPTMPEKKGLINRNNFLKIKGKSRKFSLELAKKNKITKFVSPGGGCLLTDSGFCRRIADLMRYEEKMDINCIELLKIGRHFRFSPDAKLVVGRNERENKKMEDLLKPSDSLLYVPDTGSPNGVLFGNKKYLETAASITARYSDKKRESKIDVIYKSNQETNNICVKPIEEDELAKWRI